MSSCVASVCSVVGFDNLVDLGHEADGLVQGDDYLLVVVDVLVGKDATGAGVLATLGFCGIGFHRRGSGL